jgi:hypothetical protein
LLYEYDGQPLDTNNGKLLPLGLVLSHMESVDLKPPVGASNQENTFAGPVEQRGLEGVKIE